MHVHNYIYAIFSGLRLHVWKFCNAPVTLCRLGFPTRPDFEVGVSRGSVCLSRGELGIRRG